MGMNLMKSYLQARDPSIMAYNRTNLQDVKKNLNDLMISSGESSENTETSDENKFIKVYLRLRGDIEVDDIYEINNDVLVCKVPEGSSSLRNVKCGDSMKRTYTFTEIFGPTYNQQMIFNSIAKPKLLSFINGKNSTLFTYGASGSGKTFTIVGTPEEPGLIPRSLEYIFRSLPRVSKMPELKPLPNGRTQILNKSSQYTEEHNKCCIIDATLIDKAAHVRTYRQMQERLSCEPVATVSDISDVSISVWVSFAEIYNEIIYDLLSMQACPKQSRPRLALGKSSDENTYIKNLTYLNVSNGLEAYQILQYGLHNLNYATTAINSHSSRSHSIFTVRLVQSVKNSNDVYVSNFNFCDLAGSERLKKTMNVGDRLKESNNINTSLLVLGRCMENIRKCQQVKDSRLVPFRESKLTQIFQKALLGNEKVDMIVNINPSKNMFDETIHALNFSAIAKTIIVEEELVKPRRKVNRFSMMMRDEVVATLNNGETRKDEKNMKDHSSFLQELRMLRRENHSLKEKLDIMTSNDEKQAEIDRLEEVINKLFAERDEIIEIYEKKIKEEKAFVAEIYKDSIARTEERLRKDKQNAMERLTNEYEKLIREKEVICISSSDEDDDHPKKPVRKSIKDLKEQIEHYQKIIDEFSDRLKQYQNEIEVKNRLLEEQNSLIGDAKYECSHLMEELKSYCEQNMKLKATNVELMEENESLKMLLKLKSDEVESEEIESDVEMETLEIESLADESLAIESLATESLATESLITESLATESLATESLEASSQAFISEMDNLIHD